MIVGTWCFLIGSFGLALKPTLRPVRELQTARLNELQLLAMRGRD